VKFLGHLIDARGIWTNPEKTSAILEMEPPHNITKLCRFMQKSASHSVNY